jgi:hypothetical protein
MAEPTTETVQLVDALLTCTASMTLIIDHMARAPGGVHELGDRHLADAAVAHPLAPPPPARHALRQVSALVHLG